MAAAYGWSDEGKARALVELNTQGPARRRSWVHVVASRDGRPLAVASLFRLEGHAFVTNVGTVPEARGKVWIRGHPGDAGESRGATGTAWRA